MAGLDVYGQLTLSGERGNDIDVRAKGAVLCVEAQRLGALLALSRLAGRGRGRRERVTRLQRALAHAGLHLEVRLSGVRVGTLDAGTRAGLLGRLLGLGPVRLHPAALLRAVLAR